MQVFGLAAVEEGDLSKDTDVRLGPVQFDPYFPNLNIEVTGRCAASSRSVRWTAGLGNGICIPQNSDDGAAIIWGLVFALQFEGKFEWRKLESVVL